MFISREQIDQLRESMQRLINDTRTMAEVNKLRIQLNDKNSLINQALKTLKEIPVEQRQMMGAILNSARQTLAASLLDRQEEVRQAEIKQRVASERIDVTLPVRPQASGTVHPVSQVWEEVVQIFGDLGFAVAEGPHIEDDFHNFDALNMPPEHPARQEHDTFYFNEKPDGSRMVLRTHTSPVQIRTMLVSKPPIRIIAPGRTFRSDSDMTHTPMFNQVEGLVIDETTHLGHLKWVLAEFCKAFFEVDEVKMRFRASHFPFTEPSMEIDIQYSREGGQLKIGAGDKWLEILGSGMVHPDVIRAGGMDPDKVQGFAFGMGLDRLAMLKYGIPDLRAFFEADLRWLRHYGFRALQVPTLAGGLS